MTAAGADDGVGRAQAPSIAEALALQAARLDELARRAAPEAA